MKKILNYSFLILMVLVYPSAYSQEILKLSTYYPEPAGVYITQVATTMGVGDNNQDSKIDFNDMPVDPGNLWIAGDVGLGTGTNELKNKLEVKGNAVIGEKAGLDNGPDNGITVSGKLGVGINPEVGLEVNNTLKLIPVSESDANYNNSAGLLHYNKDDHAFKYKETNSGPWIPIGSGVELGSEIIVSSSVIRSNGTVSSYAENPNGLIGDCPNNHVLVGIDVQARGHCPWSCTWRAGAIERINLICKPIR